MKKIKELKQILFTKIIISLQEYKKNQHKRTNIRRFKKNRGIHSIHIGEI